MGLTPGSTAEAAYNVYSKAVAALGQFRLQATQEQLLVVSAAYAQAEAAANMWPKVWMQKNSLGTDLLINDDPSKALAEAVALSADVLGLWAKAGMVAPESVKESLAPRGINWSTVLWFALAAAAVVGLVWAFRQ